MSAPRSAAFTGPLQRTGGPGRPGSGVSREDRRLLRAFERCTLAAGEFRHRHHVQVAWTMLRQQPLVAALPRFVRGIQRFAATHGATGLYHETITVAFLLLINERSERLGQPHDWHTFAGANRDLVERGKATLARYYSPELLASSLARRTFVLPDRVASDECPTHDQLGGAGAPP